MMIWDETKRRANLEKHGVDFVIAEGFDWLGAMVAEDDRFDYGEPRFIAIGLIAGAAYTMVFTPRGENFRIISLRPASRKERNLL
jgi:uncharacterized DUF497 family protein